jgi:simple sugar transport system ATP-binding protein
LGANGAGKSTLIKILAGLQPASSGDILIEGVIRKIDNPVQARDFGMVTVHQNIDDGVIFGMTVAENLLLDQLAVEAGNPFVTKRYIFREAEKILDELGIDLPLRSIVEDLPASGRQEVAIARALVKKPKLLVLDEPTSTLSAREAERLFDSVQSMQGRGISVLYVSHRMSEVERLCRRAVVLRNGRVVSTHNSPLDTKAIANSILGDLAISTKHEARVGADIVFEGKGLRTASDSVPFDVQFRRGEVVGITGLVGAGKTEFLEQVFGVRPLISGQMTLEGNTYRPRDAAEALKLGVAMVPEERAMQSIFPTETLIKHCSIGRLDNFSRAGFMDRRGEHQFATEVIERFRVNCSGATAEIESLSGGNQQKLLVGRWLADPRSVLILDEPFRGIDIGARGGISAALREFSKNSAVVVSSSDPEEVIEVADRVLVMVEGRIVCEVVSNELTPEEFVEIMSARRKPGERWPIEEHENDDRCSLRGRDREPEA